ncbi:MAG: PEP-CTERM sorting domain-containing protein [Opitutales bacterium]
MDATYAGIIGEDGGLGLIGETLTVDFSYDASIAPDSVFNSSRAGLFLNPVTSMDVTIGSQSWTWSGGGSSINLTDDGLVVFVAGLEDRWNLGAYDFTGPDLTSEPAGNYALEMFFYDNVPTDAPDALDDYQTLPMAAPDPALFTSVFDTVMQFSFFTGDGESGNYYNILAENPYQVTFVIPEPGMLSLCLAGISLIGVLARRRRC